MNEPTHWQQLQAGLDGVVALPGTQAYERLRRPGVAGLTEPHPQAVARCATAADVAQVVAFARRHELSLAPRSGGHCFAQRSTAGDVVVDVGPMHAVSYAGGLVTVGAGTRLGVLYEALAPAGVTVPAGCGPDVGIAGLTLGGGLGILGRRYGLTCDRLRAASVVLADGTYVTCDADSYADLFWALRGAGGGQFGVVTSLTFEPVPAPAMTAYHLTWPADAAPAVLGGWQSWAPAAPDDLAASLLLTVPAAVEEPLAVHVFGALCGGDRQVAADLLAALTAAVGVAPATATYRDAGYRETKSHLGQLGERIGVAAHADGARPVATSKSEFFTDAVPPATIATLVEHLVQARVPGQARELDCTPWAGAYNRVATDATAFAHRDAHFLVKHTVVTDAHSSAPARSAATRWLDQSWAIVHPHGAGGGYPNFPDPALADAPAAYHGTNHAQLTRVKAAYDPTELFRFPQSIRPS
ncbi:MAG: FAD-binding protein [Streptosporangiales bacterium]|nr:FAD-binding protein [Streptosporangiales bacterium]